MRAHRPLCAQKLSPSAQSCDASALEVSLLLARLNTIYISAVCKNLVAAALLSSLAASWHAARLLFGLIDVLLRLGFLLFLRRGNGNLCCPSGPPLPILLHEHPEHPGIGRGRLPTDINGLENRVIGREREVPIDCH